MHPAVIGCRIEIITDLHRSGSYGDGRAVADHERAWAWHQTITDPQHAAAAKALRRQRVSVLRPAPSPRSSSAAWPTTTPLSGLTLTADGVMGTPAAARKTARDLSAEVVPDPR